MQGPWGDDLYWKFVEEDVFYSTYYLDLEALLQECRQEDKILTDSNECESCESYTHPDSANTACVSDECSETQILLETGRCQACGGREEADITGRVCIPICPDYFYYSYQLE